MASANVPLLDEDTVDFGDEDTDTSAKGSFTHPYVTLFHLFFRCVSILMYVFCGLFHESFITSFVTIVLFLSMDFWTVKNITGRLMVGLRWWNYIDDDGKSHWVFECRKGHLQNRINDKESSIFWTALVLAPLLWSLFFIVALFSLKLKWLLVVMIALVLTGANLYGYVKCKIGNKESLGSATSNFFKKQVFQGAVSIVSRQSAPNANPMSSPSNTI